MGEPTNDSPTHMASSRVEAGSGRWQVGVGTLGRGVVVVVVVVGMGMVMVVTVVVVRRAVIVCRLRRAVVVDETVVVDGLGRVFHRPAGLGLGQHRAKGTPGLGRDPGDDRLGLVAQMVAHPSDQDDARGAGIPDRLLAPPEHRGRRPVRRRPSGAA